MNVVSYIMLGFSLLGALDRIAGNRFGIGKEFEKGLHMFGNLALSMIGMILVAPALGVWLAPAFSAMYETVGLDPSVLPAALLANDMGGAALAVSVAQNEAVGAWNAYVVSSMMGCTVSFTVPYAIGAVGKEKQKPMLTGFLAGIVTIPVGAFAGGLLCRVPVLTLLYNLVPLLLFSAIVGVGLVFFPNGSVRVFRVLGILIKIAVTVFLALGIFTYLTGIPTIPNLAPIEEGAAICFNIAIVMTGAFPMMFLISKALSRPLGVLAKKTGLDEASVFGFLSTLATSVTTYGRMEKMSDKGVVLNSAFAISAAFVFADHLAFTLAEGAEYLLPMIVGKLLSGISAVLLAALLFHKRKAPQAV